MFKYNETKKEETRRYGRGEHVMSKPEGAVMRRIQSETGMTEEEVRKIKKYRKMLSDAQLSPVAHERKEFIRNRERLLKEDEKLGINSKWKWGSEKSMFMQKACQVLNGDKETAQGLYKRYAGGLVDDRRPKAFFYRKFEGFQSETDIMKAIAQTDGQFVYSPDRNEVGFMYESCMTMFSLCYQVNNA
jgi:hypothetical protein